MRSPPAGGHIAYVPARLLSIAACAIAVLASAGAASPSGAGSTARPAAVKKAAPVAALPDAEIERNLKERLGRSKISADKFTFRVQGGVVTWDGRTDVVQHKGAATRMAKAAGARAVVNRIQTSAAAKQKAAANLTEGRRRAQVKRSERPAVDTR